MRLAVVALLAAALIVPVTVSAESLTEKQGDAILEELRQIRQVLEKMQQQQAAPPAQARTAVQTNRAKASTRNRPALGADDAPITLVEVTCYQCPFWSRITTGTLPGLKEEYIDTGKVRLVVKDLPLAMHAQARPAAVAAHCAGDQEQFWAMHDTLFENNRQLQDENLKQYAQDIGLDTKRFQECLGSDRHDAMIDADVAEANGQGITGTPTFIVAETTDDVVEGTKIRGVQSLEALRRYFDALLKASEKPSG